MSYVWGQKPGQIDDYIDASGLRPIDQSLLVANNLSDVDDAEEARLNLGIAASSGDYLSIANNLSDLASTPTARTNLGLGNSAVADFGVTSDTVASGDHLHSIYQQTSEKGSIDGYASLGADGIVPTGQLPAVIANTSGVNTGDNTFVEQWVIAPALPTSSGIKGQLAYNSNYLYTCINNNIWIRTSGESTWG